MTEKRLVTVTQATTYEIDIDALLVGLANWLGDYHLQDFGPMVGDKAVLVEIKNVKDENESDEKRPNVKWCHASYTDRNDEHATYFCELRKGHKGPHSSFRRGSDTTWTDETTIFGGEGEDADSRGDTA